LKVLGSNYNFWELIWSNQGLNCINIEVWWPIRDLTEEIWNQGPKWKTCINRGAAIKPNQGWNWRNWRNLKPRTKVKKAANFKAAVCFLAGMQLHWFLNQNCNWGLDWTNYKLRTNVNSNTFLPPFPFKWNDTFCPKRHRFIHFSLKKKT